MSRRFKQWAWRAALIFVCALPMPGAVRMDVFIGYDGAAKEGSWFPVAVEVENDGPGFNGVFQLSPGQYSQGQTRAMALELPTRTVKRFILPVYAAGRYRATWDARMLDEKGKVRAESTGLQLRRNVQGTLPIVGAVTRTASGLPVLPEVKNKQAEWEPAVARLQPVLFPDSPIALEGLSTIYLNSEKALDLKVNQVNALVAWLQSGGHLVIGVEQILHINGNEWLKRLLPCELTGLGTSAKHPELHQWVQSATRYNGFDYPFADSRISRPKSRPKPSEPSISNPYASLPTDDQFEQAALQVAQGTVRDGEVLIGSTEAPLAIMGRRGRGQITVLMFSPELEPFLSWKNRAHFWAKLADLPPETLVIENYQRYSSHSVDGVFGGIVDSKQVRKLPIGWLLVLLLGYLAVIGPLDQYWLKKINRQMLTWITFPIYVACFSGLIYLIGYRLRAGESEWNELHVVDVFAMGKQADLHGWTFGSVYSPVNARYKFTSDQPFAALRGEYLRNYYQGGQEATRLNIEQRGNSFAADLSVPVWTSQLLVSDWWRRADAPITFGVSREGTRWLAQVTNNLKADLKQVVLIIGGKTYEWDTVRGGESKTMSIAAEATGSAGISAGGGDSVENFTLRHGGQFFSAAQQRHQAFGGNRYLSDVPRSAMAASFVSYLREGSGPYGSGSSFVAPPFFDLAEIAEQGDAVLLAWTPNYSPVKPLNQFSARRNHRDTLFRISVPVK